MFYPENQGSFDIWPGDNAGPFADNAMGFDATFCWSASQHFWDK
jgi:hypothetical protein